MNKKIKAWYFSAPDKKLGYGDGRDIIIGETHTISNRPMCCSCGLHGSIRLCDALYYAKSPYLYRVEIFGKINQKTDKLCGQSRKYLSGGIDITSVLMEFSRWCALQIVLLLLVLLLQIVLLLIMLQILLLMVLLMIMLLLWKSKIENLHRWL